MVESPASLTVCEAAGRTSRDIPRICDANMLSSFLASTNAFQYFMDRCNGETGHFHRQESQNLFSKFVRDTQIAPELPSGAVHESHMDQAENRPPNDILGSISRPTCGHDG